MYNRSLLKETRMVCRQLNYQFTGKVRARKSEEDEFIIIDVYHHDVRNLS